MWAVIALTLTAGLGTSALTAAPQMDISFKLAVQGLGEATFYTFQQQLPHPTLPYALQDDWVQYVYPHGEAAVYYVAHISQPVAGSGRARGKGLALEAAVPPQRKLRRYLATPNTNRAPMALGSSGTDWGQYSKPDGNSGRRLHDYVAVKAGDAADFLSWFQQYMTATAVHSVSSSAYAPAPVASHTSFKAESCPLKQSLHSSHLLSSNPTAVQKIVQSEAKATAIAPDRHHLKTCKHRNFLLYLGMSIPLTSGGGFVSRQQLQSFLAAEVSPRVQGFTLVAATGFWEGQVEETSVLEIISDAQGIAAAVAEIAEAYKRLFSQEAVLVKENACPNILFV